MLFWLFALDNADSTEIEDKFPIDFTKVQVSFFSLRILFLEGKRKLTEIFKLFHFKSKFKVPMWTLLFFL